MTLNGSVNLGSANGLSAAALFFQQSGTTVPATETLSGYGTVTLGGSTGNQMLADGNNGAAPVSFTIGSGITIQGGSGTLGSYYGNDSLVNDGVITGNWNGSGGTLTIGGSNSNGGPNTWSNYGILTGGGGTVDLCGSFTDASLAEFNNSGGAVHLQGTLTNTTLALAPAMGNWYLSGGAVLGGTVSSTGGSALTLTTSGGTLNAVTVAAGATIDGTQAPAGDDATANIVSGLTLNGTVDLGAASGLSGGDFCFQGSQTLAGSGIVTFGGASSNASSNAVLAQGGGSSSPATLTIGSGITIQGGAGTIGGYNSNDSITNDGTITANASGGTVTVSGKVLTNQGTLSSAGAGTLNVPVALVISGQGVLSESVTSFMNFGGSLFDTTTVPSQFSLPGAVTFNGSGTASSPQLLEATSQDLGAVSAGFVNNSAYGTIGLANNTYVELVDQTHNSQGAGSEAIYTNLLVVPSGSTLNLNGLNVYAQQAQIGGTVVNGTVTQVPSGGPAATNAIVASAAKSAIAPPIALSAAAVDQAFDRMVFEGPNPCRQIKGRASSKPPLLAGNPDARATLFAEISTPFAGPKPPTARSFS